MAAERPNVLTTIAQIGEPLGRILHGCADVQTLLGPGVDPHLYRLTRTDVAKALRADAIVANGLNLEAQMQSLFGRLAPVKPVILASELLPEVKIIRPDGRSADPHIWMDPNLWAEVLSMTSSRLVEIWPSCEQIIVKNQSVVIAEIKAVDLYAESRLATVPEKARVLVTAHDAFGYFGRRYGLELLSVQGISTESEAGVAHIRKLVSVIAHQNIASVFVETSTPERAVDAVIEGARILGAQVRKGEPLFSDAMGPPNSYEGSYIGMIDHNVTTIVRGLGGNAPKNGMQALLAFLSEGER
jgi:manganese/zinc/iron transport system substrate-binding protein